MNFKAQGAIEYLLIIAAAILVVAIVIIAVTGALSGGQDQTATSQYAQKNALTQLEIQRELTQGHIQISELSDVPTWDTWTDGETYFLSDNISVSDTEYIRLENTSGITIDCLDYVIDNPVPGPVIWENNSTNITIKNCNLKSPSLGAGFNNSTNTRLENVKANNMPVGVVIYGGHTTIKNSEFCSNTHYNIYCTTSPYTDLTVENSKADIAKVHNDCHIVSGAFDPCP